VKVTLAAALALLVLTLASAAFAGSTADPPSPRYVFSFSKGLHGAPIGMNTARYQTLFQKALRLENLGADTCFGLAYAVGTAARQARTADVHLFCGDKPQITEARLAGSSFCSTGGTCVATPGSLKKFAAELKTRASVLADSECVDGSAGCSTVEASFGRIQVSVRSSNCRKFASLAAIGTKCVASDVLLYRMD
jgi:hypothetical protein